MGDVEVREVAEAIKNAARAMREEHRPTQAFEAMRVRDRQLARKIRAKRDSGPQSESVEYERGRVDFAAELLTLLEAS